MNNEPLTVTQFCTFVKDILPGKKFLVTGEVNQLKNSHGHLFFTFKDNENCLSTTIWKSKADTLKINLKEGDKITVDGRLDFYGASGKLNFIVDKIVTNEGVGDLIKKYQAIKDDFTKRGYFDSSRKKKLKSTIQNILVLTSETGAAYQDFMFAIENAKCNIKIDLIDVIVQGVDCPKNICFELEQIKKTKLDYDLVILTRGGGSFQDLFGFSQPELIETLYNFNLPTLSAIGHQIDNPLSDLACDYSTPTPSLAAQFIINRNKEHIIRLQEIINKIKYPLNKLLTNNLENLNRLNDKINNKWNHFQNKQKNELLSELNLMLRKLDSYEARLNIFNSNNIILNANGKILQSSEELLNCKEKTIEIIWNGVVVKVKIMN